MIIIKLSREAKIIKTRKQRHNEWHTNITKQKISNTLKQKFKIGEIIAP